MNLDDFIRRADELIAMGNEVLKTETRSAGSHSYVDRTLFAAFHSASLSFLRNAFECNHPYYQNFFQSVQRANPHDVKHGIGILQGVRGEMTGGWMTTVKSIVSAEIFSNFLDQASYLLSQDYKDAAAVMAGSVLEEHLRQLCLKNGIDTETVNKSGNKVPKKADTLNADLYKQGVYKKLDQKSVTGWLDLRNSAAHGKYKDYTKDQVVVMLQGVTNFMARVSI